MELLPKLLLLCKLAVKRSDLGCEWRDDVLHVIWDKDSDFKLAPAGFIEESIYFFFYFLIKFKEIHEAVDELRDKDQDAAEVIAEKFRGEVKGLAGFLSYAVHHTELVSEGVVVFVEFEEVA